MNWRAWVHTRLSDARLAVVIVVFLFLLGIYAINNASQPSRAQNPKPVRTLQSRWHGLPDYIQDPEAGARMVEQLCRKANGDISKLSEDEIKWLNAVSAGNGTNMVRMRALQYVQEHKQAQQHSKEKPTATPRPSEKGREQPRP